MPIFRKPVVYTCLFGDYERLNEQPASRHSKIPFICFTDRSDLTLDTWSVRRLEPLGIDSARESRRVKILPHLFLSEFTESLYIDGSCILKKTPEEIFRIYLARKSESFVCFRHPLRDCPYHEAEEVLRMDMDPEARIREQMDHYERSGFPRHAGLITATFLLRRHLDNKLIKHAEMWFSHVLRYSKRDQLSFNFTARKTGLAYRALNLNSMANDIFSWPNSLDRVPYHFNDQIYLWLNPDVASANVKPRKHYISHGLAEGRKIRYHDPIELNLLANKFKSNRGNLYCNRHFYSRVYDHLLSPFKSDEMTLLEIGLLCQEVQPSSGYPALVDASSLLMWSEYFSRAQVHGVNIRDFSNVEGDRITFTRADPSNVNGISEVIQRCRYRIKVIIDDGINPLGRQQISLAALFPHLQSGGLYFMENLNDQPSHLEEAGSVKTRDLLRAISVGKPIASDFIEQSEMEYLVANIADIQFYDSMDYASAALGQDALAVIRKK